jgi:hypothetical protein
VPVGGDHPLIDAPGGLDLDVNVIGEQRAQAVGLPIGEQVRSSAERAPSRVERVALPAAMPVDRELDPTPALIERLTGQAGDWNGSITVVTSGSSSTRRRS